LKTAAAIVMMIFFLSPFAAADSEIQEIQCWHFVFGIPRGTPESNDLIIRNIYALSSNDETKFADWVAYRLDRQTVADKLKVEEKWRPDRWLNDAETLEPKDYHAIHKIEKVYLAPPPFFRGSPHWRETHYCSNVVPQNTDLYNGPWLALERKILAFAEKGNTVYIVTGPLYEAKMPELPFANESHRVPSGFWKVILFPFKKDNYLDVQTAAFIFPQNAMRSDPIEKFLVSIDEIERRSGLELFWEMHDSTENSIEGRTNKDWAKQFFD